MRRRCRPAALCAAAILQFAFVTAANCHLILCVEADGRTTIESVFSAECCAPVDAGLGSEDIACDCTDVLLVSSTSAVIASPRKPAPPGAIASSPPVRSPATAFENFRRRPSRDSRSSDSSALIAQRSVVLVV